MYITNMRLCATCLLLLSSFTDGTTLAQANTEKKQISTPQKSEIFAVILAREKNIQNLSVAFTRISKWSYDKVETNCAYEWAMSGEKQYRVYHYPPPIGEPLSKRTGTAVWDGKTIKAYDSELDNGSVGNDFDPNNQQGNITTWTPYNDLLGELTHGSLGHLVSSIPEDGWDVAWKDGGEGNLVTLTTNRAYGKPSDYSKCSWTIDLNHGGVIVELVKSRRPEVSSNEWTPTHKSWSTNLTEVKPGFWFVTDAECFTNSNKPDKGPCTMSSAIHVTSLAVNVPEEEIAPKFQFAFPKGCLYYDRIAGTTMVAGADYASAVFNQQAKELMQVNAESVSPENATQAATAVTVDDIAQADALTKTSNNRQRLPLLLSAAILIIAGAGGVGFLHIAKRRKGALAAEEVNKNAH